jgi:hypothetical protein
MAKKENKEQEVVEMDNESADVFVEATTALAKMHEEAAVAAIAAGIKERFQQRLAQIQDKTRKNNNYNKGYMAALTDVYYSLNVYLGKVDKYREEENEQSSETTTSSTED